MGDAPVRVTVAFSPAPREVREWALQLGAGSTVADAIAACGFGADYPDVNLSSLAIAVWGRKAALSQVLRDRDRVEILRPLKVDPKVARRERFRKQGSRAAGLFARKR